MDIVFIAELLAAKTPNFPSLEARSVPLIDMNRLGTLARDRKPMQPNNALDSNLAERIPPAVQIGNAAEGQRAPTGQQKGRSPAAAPFEIKGLVCIRPWRHP